jgi:hypothetical protein
MNSTLKAGRRAALPVLALLSAALGTGGCTTLGFAVAGPLFTGVAAIADRSVERTIPADQVTTWGVTVDALNRMAVRLEETDKSGERWLLKGTGAAVTIHGTLDRMTTRMTKVSIRVEAGGLLADKKTGDEILNQISASLASLGRPITDVAPPSRPDLAADRLSTLQREIERLSTKLDEAKDARPSASAPPSASVQPPATLWLFLPRRVCPRYPCRPAPPCGNPCRSSSGPARPLKKTPRGRVASQLLTRGTPPNIFSRRPWSLSGY